MRALVVACAAVSCLTATGCDDHLPQANAASPPVVAPAPAKFYPASSIPAESLGMHGLERFALQIVRGVQDDHVRARLADSMRNPANQGLGIDLSACDKPSIARDLLRAGERHDGESAVDLCRALAKRGQFVLYMGKTTLAQWTGAASPLVTAMADPNGEVPAELMAYRSPTLLMRIGDSRRIIGPMLVVLPTVHPTRQGARRP